MIRIRIPDLSFPIFTVFFRNATISFKKFTQPLHFKNIKQIKNVKYPNSKVYLKQFRFFQFRLTTIFLPLLTFSAFPDFFSAFSATLQKIVNKSADVELELKQNQNKSQKTRIFHLNFELFKNLEDVDSMDEELDSDLEQCLKDWTDLSNEYAVNSKIQFNFQN
mgnify:CR=1 FL=1